MWTDANRGGYEGTEGGGTLLCTIGMVRAKARIGMKNLAHNMGSLVQLRRINPLPSVIPGQTRKQIRPLGRKTGRDRHRALTVPGHWATKRRPSSRVTPHPPLRGNKN